MRVAMQANKIAAFGLFGLIVAALIWACLPIAQSPSGDTDRTAAEQAAESNTRILVRLTRYAFAQNLLIVRRDSESGWHLELIQPSLTGASDEELSIARAAYNAIRASPLRRDLLAISQKAVQFSETGRVSQLDIGRLRYVPPRDKSVYRELVVRTATNAEGASSFPSSRNIALSIGCSVAGGATQLDGRAAAMSAPSALWYPIWDSDRAIRPEPITAELPINPVCPLQATYASESMEITVAGEKILQLRALPVNNGALVHLKVLAGTASDNVSVRLNGKLLSMKDIDWIRFDEERGDASAKITIRLGNKKTDKVVTLWIAKSRASDAVFYRNSQGRTIWARQPTPFYVEMANALRGWGENASEGKPAELWLTRNDSTEQLILKAMEGQRIPIPRPDSFVPTCAALDSRSLDETQKAAGELVEANGDQTHMPVSVTVMHTKSGEIRALASNIQAASVCRDPSGEYDVRSNKVGDAESPLCRGKIDYNLCAQSIGSTAKPVVSAAILSAHPEYRFLRIPALGWRIRCGDLNPRSVKPEGHCSESVVGISLGKNGLNEVSARYGGGDVDWNTFMARSMNRSSSTLMGLSARIGDSTSVDKSYGLDAVRPGEKWIDLPKSDYFTFAGTVPPVSYTRKPPRILYGANGKLKTSAQPSDFAWAKQMNTLFDVSSTNTKIARSLTAEASTVTRAQALWGRGIVEAASTAQALSQLAPAETNFQMDGDLDFRGDYVPIILGGGSSTWSPITLAEAYSRVATNTRVRATFVRSSKDMTPPLLAKGSESLIGLETVLLSLNGVTKPEVSGTAGALNEAIKSLGALVPSHQQLVIYAKTGTPFIDSSSPSDESRGFDALKQSKAFSYDQGVSVGSADNLREVRKYTLKICNLIVDNESMLTVTQRPDCASKIDEAFRDFDKSYVPALIKSVLRDMFNFNNLPPDAQADNRNPIYIDSRGVARHSGRDDRSTTRKCYKNSGECRDVPREGHHLVLIAALYKKAIPFADFKAGSIPSPDDAVTVTIALREKLEGGPTSTLGLMNKLLAVDGVVAKQLRLSPSKS